MSDLATLPPPMRVDVGPRRGAAADAAADAITAPATGLLSARRWQLAVKRTLDVALSTVLLLLLLPVLVVVAATIVATSRGGPIYVQERCGREASAFRMWKFRSMYRDADDRRAQLEARNECDGPAFKVRDDPRVTPVGRVLRKYSLDELPQLINVLRGDMSLVGPRPPLPQEVAEYDAHQRRRLLVKPGLTCTWQVSGRSDVDFDTWVEMDLDYIGGWSLRRDIALLVRTIPAVLTARGAY